MDCKDGRTTEPASKLDATSSQCIDRRLGVVEAQTTGWCFREPDRLGSPFHRVVVVVVVVLLLLTGRLGAKAERLPTPPLVAFGTVPCGAHTMEGALGRRGQLQHVSPGPLLVKIETHQGEAGGPEGRARGGRRMMMLRWADAQTRRGVAPLYTVQAVAAMTRKSFCRLETTTQPVLTLTYTAVLFERLLLPIPSPPREAICCPSRPSRHVHAVRIG